MSLFFLCHPSTKSDGKRFLAQLGKDPCDNILKRSLPLPNLPWELWPPLSKYILKPNSGPLAISNLALCQCTNSPRNSTDKPLAFRTQPPSTDGLHYLRIRRWLCTSRESGSSDSKVFGSFRRCALIHTFSHLLPSFHQGCESMEVLLLRAAGAPLALGKGLFRALSSVR